MRVWLWLNGSRSEAGGWNKWYGTGHIEDAALVMSKLEKCGCARSISLEKSQRYPRQIRDKAI